MGRPSRWETYADGRRPEKHKLIAELVELVYEDNEVVDGLAFLRDKFVSDLWKLRIESLAVLLEKTPARERDVGSQS